MGRFANAWTNTKTSWGVLKQDPELLWFPVFSGIATVIVMASFIAPTWFSGLITRAMNKDPNAQGAVFAVYAVMYIVLAFVTIYFNAALIHAANTRLSGGDPTVRSGLAGANARLGRIITWSLVAGTVGLLLKMLESAARSRSRGNPVLMIVSRIVVSLLGTAWALMTFFIIPVMLFEDQKVGASLKRSGKLFKQTWGETILGNMGLGLVFGLMTFGVILIALAMGFALFTIMGPFGLLPALAFLVVGVLSLTIVGSALGTIYRAALYRFATTGTVPGQFAGAQLPPAYSAATPTMTRV